MRIFAGLAAAAYVCWGALHVYLGVARLNTLATAELLAAENGWLAQSHFTLVWTGAVAVILGAFFTWRNSVVAYWMLAVIVSASGIGSFLFRVLPGLIEPPASYVSPGLWLAGLGCSTVAMLLRDSADRR